MSHPTWVRGLKSFSHAFKYVEYKSHPTWVRGLKSVINNWKAKEKPSRTLPGCVDWNAFTGITVLGVVNKSHPTWVRGLKFFNHINKFIWAVVAPYLGAWIEISNLFISSYKLSSRTLPGCVDWNSFLVYLDFQSICRTLPGCVDWNS